MPVRVMLTLTMQNCGVNHNLSSTGFTLIVCLTLMSCSNGPDQEIIPGNAVEIGAAIDTSVSSTQSVQIDLDNTIENSSSVDSEQVDVVTLVTDALGSEEQSVEAEIAVEQITEEQITEEPVAATIILNNLYDYSNQVIPAYINKDNITGNMIVNDVAVLGRVLFYDAKLSTNNTTACASCHQQALGFSDSAVVSTGVNGDTGRHSMRLINARFSEEARFFWDERASSLEEQVTQPIRDHAEMGFSGLDAAPPFEDLLIKLAATDYYPVLFTNAFGNSVVTESRMQLAMAQFIRSIQSFDSKYDQGRAQALNDAGDFTNFSVLENEGKRLFMQRADFDSVTGQRLAGTGLGCNGCHRAPEFAIDENSRNNGVISVANNVLEIDVSNTRSPSLRNIFDQHGNALGPFMHDGSLQDFKAVLDHYNDISADRNLNRNLDARLSGGNNSNSALGQKLLLTDNERLAITAFMKTLSGQQVFIDPKWSNPFTSDGGLVLSP